jgi:iron-sulfur cluster repair protein YtfE (RIC family)
MIQIGATAATIDSPIEHLMACHRRIEQRLDTLVNAAGLIADNRMAALDAIRKSLHFLDTSGALHTEDEEASLFPRLRQKLSAAEIAFIDSLEAQHVEAGSIYSEIKRLALELEVPAGASSGLLDQYRNHAEQLRTLYRDHIRAEDEILTAMARRSLDKSEISEISREMRVRRARTSEASAV